MTDPDKTAGASEFPPNEGIQDRSATPRIHRESSDVSETVKQVLDPLQRLKLRRALPPESNEWIGPFGYNSIEIAKHAKHGMPIRRRDLQHSTGIQAVVLAEEEFDIIEEDLADAGIPMQLAYIDLSGRRIPITRDSFSDGGVFVLFPDAVGEAEVQSTEK